MAMTVPLKQCKVEKFLRLLDNWKSRKFLSESLVVKKFENSSGKIVRYLYSIVREIYS